MLTPSFPPSPSAAAFAACVALGFTVEAAIGFGGTLISVGLGVFFLPLADVLAIFLPLNLLLSFTMVLRTRKSIDVRFLVGRMLPFMALGIPMGLYASARVPASPLKRALGIFLLLFSMRELFSKARPATRDEDAATRTPSRSAPILLVLGGIFHGAFATGGPLAVFVASKQLRDKAVFRSTLTALWLLLNLVVVATYCVQGTLNSATLRASAFLLPVLVLSIALGEWLHRRVPAAKFRLAIQLLLLSIGLSLTLRG